MCITSDSELNEIIRVSILLKLLIFHFFKASGFNIFSYNQRLLTSFKEAAISLRHLGKSILEGNLYLGHLEIIVRTPFIYLYWFRSYLSFTPGSANLEILIK